MYPVPPFNQRVTNKRRIEQICKVRRERPEAVRHATDVFLRLVAITIDPKRGDHVQQTLRRIAGVRTLHTVSGPFDLIAVVAAESTAEIDNILDHIGGIPGVERTMSSIVLTTKFDRCYPQSSHLRQRLTEVSS